NSHPLNIYPDDLLAFHQPQRTFAKRYFIYSEHFQLICQPNSSSSEIITAPRQSDGSMSELLNLNSNAIAVLRIHLPLGWITYAAPFRRSGKTNIPGKERESKKNLQSSLQTQ